MHCIPEGVESMKSDDYDGFLGERRKLMAKKAVNKSVWWLDIPISKVADGMCAAVSIILHNAAEEKLIVLEVPTSDMKEHLSEFSTRTHEDAECISLELTLDNMKDIRPKGSNIAFKQYIKSIYETS